MILIAVLSIAGLLGLVLLLGVIWASRYVKVGPNKAIVVSGKGGQSVITGGARFVMPVLYKMNELDLEAHTVPVERKGIYTKLRVPINVEAILVYKVNNSDESVKLAAQSLLGKTHEKIKEMVESIAEGAFRDICGKMTPEEINEDRESFQNKVTDVAKGHFEKLGIELVTFSVRHISDDKQYFVNLGAPRLAEVDRDARQRRAEADRTANVTEAEQKLGSEKRQAETQAEVLEAQKLRNVKEQQYVAETAVETAKAQQAGPKATAVAEQDVAVAQTELARKRAEQKQEELVVTIVKPAEAAKQKTVIEAQGQRQAAIEKAEGERQAKRLAAEATQYELEEEGKGEAAKIRSIGEAKGAAAKAEGEGEAAAIKAKLFAEADGLEKKAEAMKKFNDATTHLQVTLETIHILPELVRAAASPITGIDSIKVVDFGSNGGSNGNGGSSGNGNGSGGPLDRLLSVSPKTLAVVDETLRNTLGVSLVDMLQLVRSGKTAEDLSDDSEVSTKEVSLPRRGVGDGETHNKESLVGEQAS